MHCISAAQGSSLKKALGMQQITQNNKLDLILEACYCIKSHLQDQSASHVLCLFFVLTLTLKTFTLPKQSKSQTLL